MDFEWSVKTENGTIETIDGDKHNKEQPYSFLILNEVNVQRTYRCVANNSVGIGTFCEIEVAG